MRWRPHGDRPEGERCCSVWLNVPPPLAFGVGSMRARASLPRLAAFVVGVGSLSHAFAPELGAAVLAGVRHERSGAGARVPRPGLCAGDGVGAAGSDRAGRARGRSPVPAGAQSGCCCDPRSGRSTTSSRPCADTTRSLPGSACGSRAARPSPRWRMRSTTCSTASSPSGARAARRALLVQEHERRRIARELHDEVGQTLTGVMLQVEGLAGVDPRGAPRAAGRASRDRPRRHRGGTPASRAGCAPRRSRISGCKARWRHSRPRSASRRDVRVERRLDAGLPLSEEQELVVYRVAQEALTNVARHADATEVQLRLERTDEQVVLTVRDDGRGLPSDASALPRHPRHARARDAHRSPTHDHRTADRRHRGPTLNPSRPGNTNDDPTEDPHPRRR